MTVLVLLLVLLGCVTHAAAQPPVWQPDILQGRVVMDGTPPVPLAGAKVAALTASGAAEPVHSDRDGRFRIAVRDSDATILRITKAGFAPRTVALEATAAPIDVRLTRGAALAGQVVDLIGDPSPGIFVVARPAACLAPCREQEDSVVPARTAVQFALLAESQRTVATSLVAETDDRGRFRFGSLPAGRYAVMLAGRTPVFWSGDPSLALETLSNQSTPLATVTLRSGEDAAIQLKAAGDAARDLQPAPPTRSPAVVRSRDAGLIRGQVRGPGGRPIAGAIVVLESTDGGIAQIASADLHGRYALTGLRPGLFRVTAYSAGLPAAELGQERALQPGRTLTVRAGETRDGVDIEVPDGHAITGRIVDAYDEPIEGLVVQAWQRRFLDGQFVLAPATTRVHRTDDRGQYRVYGLLPGTYVIVAYDAPPEAASIRGALAPTADTRQGAGRGGRAGAAFAITLPAYVPPEAPLAYYPGRQRLADAAPVRVGQGRDLAGVDFTFMPAPGGRIDGSVLDSFGRPAQVAVTLVGSQRSGAPAPPPRAVRSDGSGTFTFAHVPPGDYVVQAASGRMTACRAEARLATACNDAIPGGGWEFGAQFVQVYEAGAATTSVLMSPGSSIVGRVVLEGGGDHQSVDPSSFALVAAPVDRDRMPAGIHPRAVVRGDGTFRITDITGPVRLAASDVPSGWYLKSVTINGGDATGRPLITGQGGTQAGVEVTFSRGSAEIHGRVVDNHRAPVAAAVVAYPTDVSHWYESSRAFATTASDADGHFVVSVPPGEYWVAALDHTHDAFDDDWRSPEVLQRLTAGARRVTLRPADRTSTELRPLR